MKKFQALMKSRFENAKKDNKGFSLVELIIAVVILGIIAVVAIGGLYSNVTKSRQNTDVSNAQSIQSALSTLSADKEVYSWASNLASDTDYTIRWVDAQSYDASSHLYKAVNTSGTSATDGASDTEIKTNVYLGDKINTILTDGLPAAKAGGHYTLTISAYKDGNVKVICRAYKTTAVDGTGEDNSDLVQSAE